jgi:molybdenum cofactor cytidylyltransferase
MDEIKNLAIGIVVLAAGMSTRMNQPKQLLKFYGKTLLRRSAETAANSICKPAVVVLGANFETLKSELNDLPVHIFFNEKFQSGLGSSIKTGLNEILKIQPDLSAVIFTLGDQPLVTAKKINAFAESFRKTLNRIIAAEYGASVGVPALFSKEIFCELIQIEDDAGAKSVIEKYSDSLIKIGLPEAAFDVDTPEDYKKLEALEKINREKL